MSTRRRRGRAPAGQHRPAACPLCGTELQTGYALARITASDPTTPICGCPHAAQLANLTAYAGLTLIDRAQAAGA